MFLILIQSLMLIGGLATALFAFAVIGPSAEGDPIVG